MLYHSRCSLCLVNCRSNSKESSTLWTRLRSMASMWAHLSKNSSRITNESTPKIFRASKGCLKTRDKCLGTFRNHRFSCVRYSLFMRPWPPTFCGNTEKVVRGAAIIFPLAGPFSATPDRKSSVSKKESSIWCLATKASASQIDENRFL